MNISGNLAFVGNISDHVPDNSTCFVEFHHSIQTISEALTITLCGINMVGSFIATTANFLVMWAITETPSLHTPSGVLLFLLALSDFAVGIFVQPLLVIKLFSLLTPAYLLYCVIKSILFRVAPTIAFVSFMAITAISFDRYLALALHLRYAAIITVNRVIKVILVLSGFPIPLLIMSFWFTKETWFRPAIICVGLVFGVVCIVMIIFSYFRIFTILRRHKKQIQQHNSLASTMPRFSHINLSKYRKSVFTILYVLGTLVLCYLPCGINFAIHLYSKTEFSTFLLGIVGTTLLLNSSINPAVYCCRIKEIRRFVTVKLRCMGDDVVRAWQVQPVNDLRLQLS